MQILIEGFAEEELLVWSQSKEFQELVFSDQPVVFTAGTSEILGRFKKDEGHLTIVFSHIDGGGEGVLIKLMNLFRKFVKEQNLHQITWVVHAVDCPKPNPKLARVLEMKGFEVYLDPVDGQAYRKIEKL